MNKDTIRELIQQHLNCHYIEVSGDDGRHFTAIVVSDEFLNLAKLKQHQRVYAALGERLQNDEIHALALKTYTKAQWEQQHG